MTIRTARVVVVGDLGRSPRMIRHAEALSRHGVDVELVGLEGADLPVAVRDDPRIHETRLPDPARHPGVLAALVRTTRLALTLYRALRARPADLLLVQSPPAWPTLPVALLARRGARTRLVVDWHNLGHTLLALRLGSGHPAVAAYRAVERHAGRRAGTHLCVSRALGERLATELGVTGAIPLRDRPVAWLATPDRARRLAERAALGASPEPDRALLVTSTSWTPDEDPAPLLEAARRYDAERSTDAGSTRPDLEIVLTGRGPLRADFERALQGLDLVHVRIRTAWLAPDDYPRLLRAADLGLSFHRSSSGADLAMKVVDMLAAGLPVCAYDYGPTLLEQLRPGTDSRLFRTGEELHALLWELLDALGTDRSPLEPLRTAVRDGAGPTWSDEWDERAAPLVGLR